MALRQHGIGLEVRAMHSEWNFSTLATRTAHHYSQIYQRSIISLMSNYGLKGSVSHFFFLFVPYQNQVFEASSTYTSDTGGGRESGFSSEGEDY